MTDEKLFKNEERAVFTLRSLYKKYGYLPFKMSKFEEYDLYVRNKDFLVSDSVITFNDTDGSLMALKPDVTFSIIKNTTDEDGAKSKVYYNENVYRISGTTHRFKEIMQAGLECIGDIDVYDTFEVVYLAAKSLASLSDSFVLDVSHMGIVKAVLDGITENEGFKSRITSLLAEKNVHEARAACIGAGLDDAITEKVIGFVGLHGRMDEVIEKLIPICDTSAAKEALDEVRKLSSLLEKTELYGKIRLDFSVVNDMNYYNGIVFKGFLDGIPEGVLSGGRYDALMRRIGRSSGAIGFALYLDLLEGLDPKKSECDVDVLLLYKESDDPAKVAAKASLLVKEGFSVSCQKSVPEKLRYERLLTL